jgi:alpha-L-fucosidase
MPINRREFVRRAGTAVIGPALVGQASVSPLAAAVPARDPEPAADPEPSAAQRRWMSLGSGLFLHFGINTYYDTEWSDGTLDPARFNPTQLDTDQWCSAARAAGMKYVVLVTKHHDGFCNWPSRYTRYSVASTPFRGDVVGALVNSARKHGLEVGFYYSLWDRHEPSHDRDEYAYVEFMKHQLGELLSDYGPVVELWFDGFWKKQRSGWEKVDGRFAPAETFIQSWRNEGAYRWQMDHLYQYIKRLQPDCMVMNNATTEFPGVPLHPVDVRSGEKATGHTADRKVWRFGGREVYLPLQIETTLSQEGRQQFSSGSWFWHPWDHSVADRPTMHGWLDAAKRLDANLLINAGPMASGRLRPEDERALRSLRG